MKNKNINQQNISCAKRVKIWVQPQNILSYAKQNKTNFWGSAVWNREFNSNSVSLKASNLRKKIIHYKNNKLIISPLNKGVLLKIKWFKKLSYFRFKKKMNLLKKNLASAKSAFASKFVKTQSNKGLGLLPRDKSSLLLLAKKRNKNRKKLYKSFSFPFSKLFTSLRNIKLEYIRYYKFPLRLKALPKVMTKNPKILKGFGLLNSYDNNLIELNNLSYKKEGCSGFATNESLKKPVIDRLKLNVIENASTVKKLENNSKILASSLRINDSCPPLNNIFVDQSEIWPGKASSCVASQAVKENTTNSNKNNINFINTNNNELLYNLNSLKNIKSQITMSPSVTKNLTLNNKLDLAFTSSQSKDMRENLFSKFNLNLNTNSSKSGLNTLSSKNLFTSISSSFLRTPEAVKGQNLKAIALSKEENKNLPSQPKIKLAFYNQITYPYKKKGDFPSLVSTYSTWKSGNSVYTILNYAFERMACLISKPCFIETPDKLTIQLSYYNKYWNKSPKHLIISGTENSLLISEEKGCGSQRKEINSNWLNILKDALAEEDNLSFFETSQSKKLRNLTDFIALAQALPNSAWGSEENKTHSLLQTETFLINNKNKFKNLCLLLSQLFNKQVRLELTRIKRPYFDVTILTQLFHKNTQSRKSKLIKLVTLLFYTLSRKYKWNSSTPSLCLAPNDENNSGLDFKSQDILRGFKLKLGGRLLSQKIIPRISSKTYNRGKLARGKVHFVNTSRITNKHKRGAYSITITTSSVML